MSAPTLHTVHGQPSWSFRSSHVHAHLTKLGGHLGPVSFRLSHRLVSPFSTAPWAEEPIPRETPPLLRALRGDFFCAPFGENASGWRGEQHPVHGETANARWQLRACEKNEDRVTLHARLQTSVRPGRVDKYVTLIDGQPAVYQRHVISGARGPMTVGHHAMLKFPDVPSSGLISASGFVHGQVFPGEFESPENRGYQTLEPGATFRSLERVPRLGGGHADLTHFPARRGYEDLVMITAEPEGLAWTAVTFPAQRYAWLALRDPGVLRHTVLWLSNGGRHYPPWNGRHTSVMGIEDVTSYFHYGLAESAKPNPLSRRGIPTTLTLNPKKPTAINYIMTVAELPAGFDRVATVRRTDDGIELVSANGKRAQSAVDVDFLQRS
jgi:hypothetical protein